MRGEASAWSPVANSILLSQRSVRRRGSDADNPLGQRLDQLGNLQQSFGRLPRRIPDTDESRLGNQRLRCQGFQSIASREGSKSRPHLLASGHDGHHFVGLM